MYLSTVRLFVFLVCVLLFPSCGWHEKSVSEEEKKTGLFVINVLDKAWYDDCHIKGSINVPLQEFDEFVKKLDTEKTEIVVYCSNYFCTSSGYVCKNLKDMGFKNVWAYEGGIAEWYQLGFPVEGPSDRSYLSKKVTPVAHEENTGIPVISAEELLAKMG